VRGSECGFTLLEMLVALAVFSLAALALLRLEGATVRQTGQLDERMLAQLVARNIAVETLTSPELVPIAGGAGSVSVSTAMFRATSCASIRSSSWPG
jgi:general secretion pathway protein I